MPRVRRLLAAVAVGVLAAVPVASVMLAEGALRVPPGMRTVANPELARGLAREAAGEWRPVEIEAADGVPLRAWWIVPGAPSGDAAILLHGVADTRLGMVWDARILLGHGFSVLLPDARGHGTSGGQIISFGLREVDDLRRWAAWVLQTARPRKIYGLGVSMGAAILLESLRDNAPFTAVVADCPFATFEEIAYDRLHLYAGLGRTAAWPLVQTGLGYVRLSYGLDLRQASPLEAVRRTRVPVLLIHGTADRNIPPRHSNLLHAANPATEFWEVPDAGHVASSSVAPAEYERRLVEWFAEESTKRMGRHNRPFMIGICQGQTELSSRSS